MSSCALVALACLWAGQVYANQIATLTVEGAARTRHSTLAALLPRALPTTMSPGELREFERRVRNLGIFDEVQVHATPPEIVVRVREKFTLSPIVEFSSGATARDTFVLLGATEYNLLGTASALTVFASYEQRGLNGVINFSQHPYARGRWGIEVNAYFTSADFRFENAGAETGWLRHQTGMDLLWKVPFDYRGPWRLAVGAFALREWVSNADGVDAPATGVWTGAAAIIEADRHSFHDLVPSGWRSTLELYPSVLLPSWQPRPEVAWTSLGAVPTWRLAVLTGRLKASGVWGGNVNHSMLLGSLEGVRGLSDALFRNRVQVFANLELRQSVMLATRWAGQGVAFMDGAIFQPFNAQGQTQHLRRAAAFGAGVRLVPLWLTGIVLRLDVAKPLTEPGPWFLQIALSQYF